MGVVGVEVEGYRGTTKREDLSSDNSDTSLADGYLPFVGGHRVNRRLDVVNMSCRSCCRRITPHCLHYPALR